MKCRRERVRLMHCSNLSERSVAVPRKLVARANVALEGRRPGERSVENPNGPLGTPLAGAPPFQGNIRARYEFTWNGYGAFAQIGAVHQSHSFSTAFHLAHDLQGNSTVYDLPAFTTYDAALGVTKDAWLVQLYAENLTDTRAQLYAFYTPS